MKPMKTRDVVRKLLAARCTLVRRGSRHDVYQCPCKHGHTFPVPASHGEVTAGVIRSISQQAPCLGEWWK